MSEVRLEPVSGAHLPAIRELVRDPVSIRFTRIPEPMPPDFPERWLARYESGRGEGTREGFAIVEGEGTFLGLALAPVIDVESRTVELGYMVAVEARGRGVASEALRLLTDWAFAELDARRIELLISVDNAASKRVAERCGYTFEGVLRSVYLKPELRGDTEIWSRLPGDA